ncbi:GtrA family protein [Escherichia coli]|nr:GtrA family protein [Escherichia coli]
MLKIGKLLTSSFFSYLLIGIVNTALHWGVFYACYNNLAFGQGRSNIVGFICAATFSFFANARCSFKVSATKARYFIFIFFMGAMSYLFGVLFDLLALSPIFTLFTFSLFSLVLGYCASKYFIFR